MFAYGFHSLYFFTQPNIFKHDCIWEAEQLLTAAQHSERAKERAWRQMYRQVGGWVYLIVVQIDNKLRVYAVRNGEQNVTLKEDIYRILREFS